MSIIGDTSCPSCRERGRDKTGNHLMLFSDGGGYCNRCGYTKPRTEQQEEEYDSVLTFEQIEKLPSKALRDRKIKENPSVHYGVKVAFNTSNGEDELYAYPIYLLNGELVAYRTRSFIETGDPESLGHPERIGEMKKFRNVIKKEFYDKRKQEYIDKFKSEPPKGWGPLKDVKVQMFGQKVTPQGGKRLLITAGQDDMLAAFQMLHEKYPQYTPSVVSVTHGENLFSIECNVDYINSFEEVIVCLDPDDTGKKATEKVVNLLGPRVKVMTISEKDPNDMLKQGKQAEFIKQFFEAQVWRPTNIITVEDVWEQATTIPQYGREWPWPSLTKLTYGRRGGEGIYVGAGVKVGKTEFLTQMIHHILFKENRPIFGAKFEQSEALTFQTIAGKRDKIAYHNPDTYIQGRANQGDLEAAIRSIGRNVHLFKAGYSDAGQGDLWERLKGAIRYEVMVNGVKDVFIDPITQLTDGLTASDTETYLRKFSNEMQALSQELDFFYYIFCHLKEPSQGTPHEEGGRVKAAQFRGSRAMAEKTKFMLGIERNILAEDEEERNTSTFRLLLNSGFGKAGSFQVVYNPETTDYLEPERSF